MTWKSDGGVAPAVQVQVQVQITHTGFFPPGAARNVRIFIKCNLPFFSMSMSMQPLINEYVQAGL